MLSISVVIPCYNNAKYLKDCLNSILTQTLQPSEVIVIDDGSDDESSEVARQYPFVSVITHESNRGIAAATNSGIYASVFPYVALLDSDDKWHPNHLAVLSKLLDDNRMAAVAFSKSRSFHDFDCIRNIIWGMKDEFKEPSDLSRECFDTVVIPGSTALIRRAALDNVGYYNDDYKFASDYDLWLRLSLRYKFTWNNTVTVQYRKHKEQMSYKYPIHQWEDIYRSRGDVVAKLIDNNDPRAEEFKLRLTDKFCSNLRSVWRSEDRTRLDILNGIAERENKRFNLDPPLDIHPKLDSDALYALKNYKDQARLISRVN